MAMAMLSLMLTMLSKQLLLLEQLLMKEVQQLVVLWLVLLERAEEACEAWEGQKLQL